MKKSLFAVAACAALLTGCYDQKTAIDQGNLCTYSNNQEAAQCKNGQLSFFRPNSWGSDQYPLLAVAYYCDFTHPVVHTKGGVVCVFTTKRKHLLNN